MDSEVTRIARTLADHAMLLLALGVVVVGLALAGVVTVVRFVARYRDPLLRVWAWVFARARRVPLLGSVLERSRAIAPTSYVALHLVLGLVAVACVMAFVVIAEEMVAGRAVATFDRTFAAVVHDRTSPAWYEFFSIVTRFGSNGALTAGSAVVAASLLLRRAYVLAAGWVVAQAGGGVLNTVLKNAFERARPESADALLAASSWSFPSGHAMGTFVFCGLGAYLLLRLTRSWTITVVVVAVALAWCLVMAFTRLYLGVHFVSDVVAGMIAAAAWVAVCISGLEIALRRIDGKGQRDRLAERH
ncbi:MAG: phosphatase PAP2 family protein [bacterium]